MCMGGVQKVLSRRAIICMAMIAVHRTCRIESNDDFGAIDGIMEGPSLASIHGALLC